MYTIKWSTQKTTFTTDLDSKNDVEAVRTTMLCLNDLMQFERDSKIHCELYLFFTDADGHKHPLLNYYGQCFV